MICKRELLTAAADHPETLPVIRAWHGVAAKAKWTSLVEVRAMYPSADQVGNVLIFNIPGGNYRLIVRVSYTSQRLYHKALLTHAEYDRKGWMKWA